MVGLPITARTEVLPPRIGCKAVRAPCACAARKALHALPVWAGLFSTYLPWVFTKVLLLVHARSPETSDIISNPTSTALGKTTVLPEPRTDVVSGKRCPDRKNKNKIHRPGTPDRDPRWTCRAVAIGQARGCQDAGSYEYAQYIHTPKPTDYG